MEKETASLTMDDLIAGHACLDFLNTTGGGAKSRENERLLVYEDLVEWALLSQMITSPQRTVLRRLAKASPEDACTSLERAKIFREALHHVFVTQARGEKTEEGPLQAVREEVSRCLLQSELKQEAHGFSRSVDLKAAGFDTILLRIGLLANDLLLSDDLRLVKNCDRCSWLYLDRSKGRRRRWCSMRACGNRAKVQRFAKRQRAEARS